MKLQQFRERVRSQAVGIRSKVSRLKTKEGRRETAIEGLKVFFGAQPYILAAPGIVLIMGAPLVAWVPSLIPHFQGLLCLTGGLALVLLSMQVTGILRTISHLLRQVQASIVFHSLPPNMNNEERREEEIVDFNDKMKFH